MLVIWVFFLNALVTSTPHNHAGRFLPPTNLSHKWIDDFTVKVFWLKPSKLPEHCKILYSYEKGEKTMWTSFTKTLLKSDAGSPGWNFTVRTTGSCGVESEPASIFIDTPEPRAKLATDFKCVVHAENMKCSWIPSHPSVNLNLSYRFCGETEEIALKQCDWPFHDGIRNGCMLSHKFVLQDVCMLLTSDQSKSTFRPLLVLDPPKLNISVKNDLFILSWTPPVVGKECGWSYELCYYRRGEQVCKEYTKEGTSIPYDEKCRFDFHVRVKKCKYCKHLESDFSPLLSHGVNESREFPLMAVIITTTVFLSIVVLLTCYCLRRHHSVLYPIIPDPSAFLNDMMIGVSTEVKGSAHIYTPAPELIETCKIMESHEQPHRPLSKEVLRGNSPYL